MTCMHYVYHPTLGNKVVSTSEYETLLGDGWYDTPTKFPKAKGIADTKDGEGNAVVVPPTPKKKVGAPKPKA